jgi:hypothetical protein
MKPGILIISLCFLIGEPIAGSCFAQTKEDKRIKQLENERRKLDSTRDPANRAKSLMKIAEITLTYISDAANTNDLSTMELHVGQYRKAVSDARDAMMRSGFDPHKKSGGYRAVEIALRKQIRSLQDIARLLMADDREPIDQTIDLTIRIRDEFIRALFY